MTAKKERGRFTIKFNENDPAHEAVIRLLERQPPRSKAQLVANALLHYMNWPATEAADPPSVSREAIEKIVLEILRRQAAAAPGTAGMADMVVSPEQPSQSRMPPPNQAPADARTLNLIADTMSAFRGGQR